MLAAIHTAGRKGGRNISKKVVDKKGWMWYSIQALRRAGVEREAEARTERAAKKAQVHERDESKNF